MLKRRGMTVSASGGGRPLPRTPQNAKSPMRSHWRRDPERIRDGGHIVRRARRVNPVRDVRDFWRADPISPWRSLPYRPITALYACQAACPAIGGVTTEKRPPCPPPLGRPKSPPRPPIARGRHRHEARRDRLGRADRLSVLSRQQRRASFSELDRRRQADFAGNRKVFGCGLCSSSPKVWPSPSRQAP